MACIILRPQTQKRYFSLFYHNSVYFLFSTPFSQMEENQSQLIPFYSSSVFLSWSESLGLHGSSKCLERARCQESGAETLTSDCHPFEWAPAESSRCWWASSVTLEITAAFASHCLRGPDGPKSFLCLSAPLSNTLLLYLLPHPTATWQGVLWGCLSGCSASRCRLSSPFSPCQLS